jgi:hypothetical protein
MGYHNGLGLAVPERAQVENLHHAIRYLQAIKRIRTRHVQLNLTTSQMQQLKDREHTEKAAFESSMRDLYQSVWLPVIRQGKLEIEKVTMAGRPLAAHGGHERLMELLIKVSPPRVFVTVTADKIVELMRLGSGENAPLAASLAQVVESFYGVLDFPRLESASVSQKAIAEGVAAGVFGYVGRSGEINLKQLREQSEVYITANLVRIGTPLPETQIDTSAGIIVLPEAIESETLAETTERGGAALVQNNHPHRDCRYRRHAHRYDRANTHPTPDQAKPPYAREPAAGIRDDECPGKPGGTDRGYPYHSGCPQA